jgi:hypothetical protein
MCFLRLVRFTLSTLRDVVDSPHCGTLLTHRNCNGGPVANDKLAGQESLPLQAGSAGHGEDEPTPLVVLGNVPHYVPHYLVPGTA